jgi:hypothetical protein
MHFDITPLASPSSILNDGVQKIRASVAVPPPWRMDNHLLSIQSA